MADITTPCIRCGERPRTEKRRKCDVCVRAEKSALNRAYYLNNLEYHAARKKRKQPEE